MRPFARDPRRLVGATRCSGCVDAIPSYKARTSRILQLTVFLLRGTDAGEGNRPYHLAALLQAW